MYKRVWKWYQPIAIALDLVLVNVALLVAYWLRYELQWFREVEPPFRVPFSAYWPSALLLTVTLLAVYLWEGVYTLNRGRSWLDEVLMIAKGTITSIAALIIISLFYRPTLQSRLIYAYDLVIIVILLGAARLVTRHVLDRLRRRGIGVDRVLVVGAGESGRVVMRNIVARPELGYQLVGFVDDAPEKARADLGRIKALGTTAEIPNIIQEMAVDEVIITLPWMSHRKMLNICEQCKRQRVVARIVPDLFQLRLSEVDIDDLDGVPLIGLKETSIRGWNRALKRALDLVVSALGLVALSPLLLVIGAIIRLDSPGPALFRQTRVGYNGSLFTVFKFRTMRQDAEAGKAALLSQNESTGPLFKMRNDPRRTRIGKWLRRSSLDELPQLYNVLRGEMSLVGPRPATPDEVAQYNAWHMKRLEAAPGMAGLSQVSGRSELTFEEIVLLDLYYIENWSLLLDFKILLRMIPSVLFGRGAF
ncbi:MAG: undecaprenyl-phosphate glucose phosphotransferase [Chloroflexi bacterium]|nr:undecaprenyl-phosphate glucose phosphotransferase [Chloroflexota bacterium]